MEVGNSISASLASNSGSKFGRPPHFSIHRWKDNGTVKVALVTPSREMAESLARTVGAEAIATSVDDLGLPMPTHAAQAIRGPHHGSRHSGQRTLSDLADWIEREGLADGEIVSIGCSLIGRGEYSAIQKWKAALEGERMDLSDHPWWSSPQLCRVSIIAGSDDPARARGIVAGVAAHIPSYDFGVKERSLSNALPIAAASAAAVAITAAAVELHLNLLFGGDAIAGAAIAALATKRWNPRYRPAAIAFGTGEVPVSARRMMATVTKKGASPHRPDALCLAPRQMGPLLATSGEMSALAASTDALPPAMLGVQGARIGADPEGRSVRVPDSERIGGVFVVGDKRTGKSTALLQMWASDLARRRHPAAAESAMIWLETKGEGAGRAWLMAQRAGYGLDDVVIVNLADGKGTHHLDLIDRSLPLTAQASNLTDAMRYALGPSAIMGTSRAALGAAFAVVLGCPPKVYESLGLDPYPNPMTTALALLGGGGSEVQKRLIDALRSHAGPAPAAITEDPNTFAAAMANFDNRYLSMAASKRDSIVEAPRNKLDVYGKFALWQQSKLRRVTWRELLERHAVVIVNAESAGVGETESVETMRMVLHSLWVAIKQECGTWHAEGKSVRIFNDELHDLVTTNHSEDLIEIMEDTGGSRGVCLALATQRYSQLPDSTAHAVRSMSTKIYLRSNGPELKRIAVEDLWGEDDKHHSARDIEALEPLRAYVRTRNNGMIQPPFSLRIPPDAKFSAAHDGDETWEW